MANYLDDEEDLLPIDDEEDDLPQARMPVQVPPDLRRIVGAPPPPPGVPFEVQDATNKRNEAARIATEKPAVQKPKWWQKLAAAAVGGMSGYANAEGRLRHPIDAAPAADAILMGGQGKKLADWRDKVQAAHAASEAADSTESAWWKNRQMQSQERLQDSQEKRNEAMAGYEDQRNQTALEGKKIADARERDDVLLKNPDAFMIAEVEKANIPQGWQAVPSASRPGMLIAKPPSFMTLPPELVPYSSGAKAGDKVPYSRFKAAQDAAAKDTLQQNKPIKEPAENIDRILLNPDRYTPDQVRKAQEMFDKVHRPPVNNFMNTDAGKQAMEETAQSLARGDLSRIRDISSMRGDQRLQLYARAKQINPAFNTSELDRKIKMEDYYANGKGANNLQSFGTFLEHAGAASDAVNSIRQTNSSVINKPLNWWRKNMAGDPTFQSFITSLEPVRKEFEGFLLGGRALYGDDRKQAEIILNENSSPAAIQAAMKTMGHTASARFNEENFRYKKVMGRDLVDPLSPEAIVGAQKIGTSVGGKSEAAPKDKPIVQHSASTGQYRYSLDGGKTWLLGQPPQ